ncbi:hypothetical protein ACFL0Y_02105 [Patescibacteria group bacterium]
MLIKQKIIKKFLALILAFLLVANPVAARVVLAEEVAELPPEETVVQPEETTSEEVCFDCEEESGGDGEEVPAETTGQEGPEEVLPEETASTEGEDDTSIGTGDAVALTDLETEANTSEVALEGEVTTDPADPCDSPEISTDCPGGLDLDISSSATVANEATSLAQTGDNQIENSSGDASIDTGGAAAGVDGNTQVNTNDVSLEGAGQSGEADSQEGEGDGEGEIEITTDNQADVDNDLCALAETGSNSTENIQGQAVINTGDALAWVNLLNFINTNFIGSQVEFLFLDLLDEEVGEGSELINLHEIWQEILGKKAGGELGSIEESEFERMDALIKNLNQVDLTNNVCVLAETGQNEANQSGSAEINTGDATALANILNLTNVNVFGSEILFFIINIFGSSDGDLVLPRPENFTADSPTETGEGDNGQVIEIEVENQAEVENELMVEAQTGDNQIIAGGSEAEIESGDATALANVFSLVNLTVWQNDWFFLIINTLGGWTGQVFGWASPDGVESQDQESQTYQLGSGTGPGGGNGQGSSTLSLENSNQALVGNNLSVMANTGENEINDSQESSTIKTGEATALVNLFNLINFNLVGGRMFFGVINVLGNWSGNIIFAYPDVLVSLSNGSGQIKVGETTSYTLSYENKGYDEANNVVVAFELPDGLSYLGDTSGLTPEISGQSYLWTIGTLGIGESNSFQIQVHVEPDFNFDDNQLSFWSKIFPQAHAAENEISSEIVAVALIATGDPESDTNNNSDSVKTKVYASENDSEGDNQEVDQSQPVLSVTATNNVNQFVYSGDIVTFEVVVKNESGVKAKDVLLTHQLFNGLPENSLGVAEFKVGDLSAGKGVKLSFGLKMGNGSGLSAGDYHTVSQVIGYAPNGNKVVSNQAGTDFEIKLKTLSALIDVQAKEEEEDVLGVASAKACLEDENILPYVLLLTMSSLWLIDKSRKMAKLNKSS